MILCILIEGNVVGEWNYVPGRYTNISDSGRSPRRNGSCMDQLPTPFEAQYNFLKGELKLSPWCRLFLKKKSAPGLDGSTGLVSNWLRCDINLVSLLIYSPKNMRKHVFEHFLRFLSTLTVSPPYLLKNDFAKSWGIVWARPLKLHNVDIIEGFEISNFLYSK